MPLRIKVMSIEGWNWGDEGTGYESSRHNREGVDNVKWIEDR